MIYPWTRDQIQSPINSSLFGHSGQKKGETCEGEHSFDLRYVGSLIVIFTTFVLSFSILFLISVLFLVFVFISMLYSIFLYF